MNKFKEHNITIITETEEQRVIENRQRYFWNNQPIKYSIGKDIIKYYTYCMMKKYINIHILYLM